MNGAEISGRPVPAPKRSAGKKAVRNRLARIIGHLRAVSNMAALADNDADAIAGLKDAVELMLR